MNSYFKNDRHFKKSSACLSPEHPVCVSVAISPEKEVAVKQSNDPDRATLVFSSDEWNAFIKGVKNGEFDLS
ncbi:DUF397 domain-containing protein [Endozoicomonas gorgoniicola]|uniref:DUF397 domain-containing protein n=1 Tax=Endozoicomonas gorgoniicola TaxID=1234144 RepID=A0ABT3MPZ5_9GAMM|nr:DUF397 domain-containing protein [Endozoicomonas gorgoniicola]MCW7551445.1 DUF397 domain-containing protein [Endozoicomonas gorgoniicola]